ncbi:MAG: sulfatase, partial [Planctomycetia bacterium]|nr:sulfatase [Planctomycetia bacterium]
MHVAVVFAACAWPATAAATPVERPNIILMLADDQGWNGLSVEMAPGVAASRGDVFHTPHLERLAAAGMRFSSAYAPSPVCSPTRASLQTGRSPAALHWTKAAPPEQGHLLLEPTLVKAISNDETTIGEILRHAGYATAHYESDGDTGNDQASRFTDPNPADIFGMAARADAFMARNARAGRPFFIQLSWNALHAAEHALAATRARVEERLGGADDRRVAVAAITEDIDTGVGMVLDAVERHGLADTTFVIYTSDNGAGGGGGRDRGRQGGLSGGKGSV